MKPNQLKVLIFFIILTIVLIAYESRETGPFNPAYSLYDVHEHVAEGNMDKLLYAMEENNVSFTLVVGSPISTLSGGSGFKDYKKNNEFLINSSRSNPIFAFCTLDPRENDSVEVLKDCADRGASGLKLYSGHRTSFYDLLGPLDREEMLPVYAYAEENNIPVIFHVNSFYGNIRSEFENVLTRYPNLVVNCPHYCVALLDTIILRQLFDTYPNLYADITFGASAQDGFERISKNARRYRWFMIEYQDRFLFGSDMVITAATTKEFARDTIACHRKLLEEKEFECNTGKINGNFSGLNLPHDVLKKIYHDNPKRFLEANG